MKNRMTGFSRLIFPVLCTLLLAEIGLGQAPALWGEIKPGPYAVGFGTIEKYDYSRTFQPAKDYFGNPVPGQTARPIQVCYWYPAEPHGGTRMIYSEYAFPYPSEPDFFGLLSQLQNRELGTLFFFLGNNQGLAQDLMNLEMLAVRDAPPAPGPFPLIVYHGSERGAYSQNVVLCEYLASHGFVVATTHVIGAAGFDASDQSADIEAVVRDKELAVATLHDLPFVDAQRLGLIGYNYGITTALIHQMRNYSVDAVLTLYSRYTMDVEGAALLRSNSYNPVRMQVPWMLVTATADSIALSRYLSNTGRPLQTQSAGQMLDIDLVDTLQYCPLYAVTIPCYAHVELSVYGVMAAISGADSTLSATSAQEVQSSIAPYVRHFFDADLNDSDSSHNWLNNIAWDGKGLVLGRGPERRAPPTPEQFQRIIQTYGTDRASQLVSQFNLVNPADPIMPDATFTQLGYQFLQRGDVASSLVVFRWGVTAYPQSANAWDSYAEATLAAGDEPRALELYRRALEVLPQDTTTSPDIKELIRNNATQAVERLQATGQ
jgi:hypothetical protein